MIGRALSRLVSFYTSGAVLVGSPIFVVNIYNAHKYVQQSWKDDTIVEFAATSFTYTWVASVKSFGAGAYNTCGSVGFCVCVECRVWLASAVL